MKDKLKKAYHTVWRWPEVYSDSTAIIWTSRAIAIAIPLVLISLTFLTGVPLFGWAVTGVIAAFIGFALIATTIRTFYGEYETVESFEVRESRVKEYFHGFPAHTDVPIMENAPGEWIAYGHIDPKTFLSAISTVILHVTEDSERAEYYLGLENQVGQLYATFRNPEDGHWDEGLDFCKPSSEHCFPITRIEI